MIEVDDACKHGRYKRSSLKNLQLISNLESFCHTWQTGRHGPVGRTAGQTQLITQIHMLPIWTKCVYTHLFQNLRFRFFSLKLTHVYCLLGCLEQDCSDTCCFGCLICMCFVFFCIYTYSAQLSMFHMERHSRNTFIIIIIIKCT